MILTDLPSERGYLAGVCRYGSDVWVDNREIVNENCFNDNLNRCIFVSLEKIFANNIQAKVDLLSILSSAQELGLQTLGEPSNIKYIKQCFDVYTDESNVKEFAKKIRKLSEFRDLHFQLLDSATNIGKLTGGESLSEAVSIAEKPIFDFTSKLISGNEQVEQIAIGIDDYYEYLRTHQGELNGISIGSPIYENAVGGIRVGVHIIGARKKCGKSYFAAYAATWASYKEKVPVLYLDTELHRSQGQWDRFLARFCQQQVSVSEIKKGTFFENEAQERIVFKAKEILKRLPLDYINITGRTVEEIISIMRRWLLQKVGYNEKGELKPCLIVYDYLKPPADSKSLKDIKEHQEMGFRLDALHAFTAKYDKPILTFVQLNRENDIALSDRIGWFCTSYSSLSKKTPEEISADGPANGNRKLTLEDIRFGEGLEPGDYINYGFSGKYTIMKELKTRNQIEAEKANVSTSGDNQ